MRMAGVSVCEADCRTLVDLLHRVGRDDDLRLAARIDRGFEREIRILALSVAERDRLLGVLNDPPDGLVELRGVLVGEQRDRLG